MIKVGERLEDVMKEKYSRKKLTDEEYKRRIYDLYGDDISVLEPYVNQRTKILHRCKGNITLCSCFYYICSYDVFKKNKNKARN